MDSQLTAIRIAHEAHIDTDNSGSQEEVPRGDRRIPGRRRITTLASSDEEDDAPDEQHEETEQEEEEGAGPAGAAPAAAFGEGGGAGESGEGFVEEPSPEHMSIIGVWGIENLILFCALAYRLVGGGTAGEEIRQPNSQAQRQERLANET